MHDQLRTLVDSGQNLAQAMEATGLSKIEVLRLCAESGLLERLTANGRKPRKQSVARVRREMVERQKVSDATLREMVEAGKRVKQIAIECGMTHQAVYQRLRKAAIVVPPRPVKKSAPKMSYKYGITMDLLRYLWFVGATRAFTYQRNNAKQRGIGWELTLEQWWDIWERSGKWEKRGRNKGGYVMGRHGDLGPYAVGNVAICSHQENVAVRESHSPSTIHLQKGRQTQSDMRAR